MRWRPLCTGEHPDWVHFPCLVGQGYPNKCTARCFPYELVAHLIRLKNAWQIDCPADGATGWITEYNYADQTYEVVFDTGAVHWIPFPPGALRSLRSPLKCQVPFSAFVATAAAAA